MSVESSTKTVYSLTTNRTRISLLHHPSSSGVLRFRNFVKYYVDPNGNSDVYVVKADNQDEAIGQVLSNRAIVPGDEKPVDIVLFEGGAGSATGQGSGGVTGYNGEAFESISGPDINGVITLTRGDATTETININDISLDAISYDSITKSLNLTVQDEEGNNVSTFNVPLSDLVDVAPDSMVCYKVTDSANPLTSYTFTNPDIAHFGIGGEFKFRTTTVNGVESAEQNIHYYDVNTDEFLPANYPLIVAAIKAHLDAESVSYESVDFNVLDHGDGTHTTEVIVLSTNTSINTGTFQVKYNRAFQVNQISAVADSPVNNEKFYKRKSLDGVDSWFQWDGFDYVALGSTPDFTGLTVEIDHCKDVPEISADADNRIQKRDDGIYVPPVASPGTQGYTRYRGQINAATASLPTDAQLGDYWYVSTDGDNLGNIEGVDYLSKGDYVTYLNLSGDDDRSNPQNWTGHQRNTDDRFTNLVSIEDDLQTVNLVALTPLQVNAVNLFFGDIRDVTLRDSNDYVLTDGISIQIFPKPNAGAPPYIILTANQNITGLKVYMRGRPS